VWNTSTVSTGNYYTSWTIVSIIYHIHIYIRYNLHIYLFLLGQFVATWCNTLTCNKRIEAVNRTVEECNKSCQIKIPNAYFLVLVTKNRVWIGSWTHKSYLHVIITLLLIHALYFSLQHLLSLLSLLCLQSLPSNGSQQCNLLPCSRPYRVANVSQPTQSRSHVTTNGQSASQSWCQAPI
jgi:hypothetical protein